MPASDWDESSELLRFVLEFGPTTEIALPRWLEAVLEAQVEYFPAGPFPADRLTDDDWVLLSGVVELRIGERSLDTLVAGDRIDGSGFEVWVLKDSACWRIPRNSRPTTPAPQEVSLEDVLTVKSLPPGSIVEVEAETPIPEVALLMSRARTSAAIVRRDQAFGIVTDRDIRARFVARSLVNDQPVSTIATFPARVLDPNTTVAQARGLMLQLGIHHLPVIEGSEVVGLVTDVDLLELGGSGIRSVRREIESGANLSDVASAGQRIRSAISRLADVGVDVERIGLHCSILTDVLVNRLLELAQVALGEIRGPFAWVALGSWGRREQGLVFDQDHALVYEESDPARISHLVDVAAFVESGLEAAGIPRCPSHVMASAEGWHGNRDEWEHRLSEWLSVPERKAAFFAATAFDGRRVAGDLDLSDVYARMVSRAAQSQVFLNGLARLAIDLKVPLGFFGDLITTDDGDHPGLDLKVGGLLPTILLARRWGLMAGVGAATTTERLRRAAEAGVIDEETAIGMTESYQLIRELSLENHRMQFQNGSEVSDEIDPASLGPIQRRSLREAFRLLRRVQRQLLAELQPVRWR